MVYPRIKDLREDMDLSQADVARILNCSQAAYSYYENGKRDVPTVVLIKLASLYSCSTDYLLGLSDEREITRKKVAKNRERNFQNRV